MSIEAHVAVPVIDDGEQTEPGQPIGIDDPALVDRLDGRTSLRGHQHAIPFHAAGPRITEPRHEHARPRARRVSRVTVAKALLLSTGNLSIASRNSCSSFSSPACWLLQPLQALRLRVGFRRQAREHHGALARACSSSVRSARCCFSSSASLASCACSSVIELGDGLHVVLDGMDLLRARPSEIAVVDEHPAGARRILLIEQQLQRLLMADQIGGAQLSGQRAPAFCAIVGLPSRFSRGQRARLDGTFRALAADAVQALARLADRHFCGPQLSREAVPLDLLPADLPGDAVDLGLDRLQLGLRLPGVAFGPGGRRAVGRRAMCKEQAGGASWPEGQAKSWPGREYEVSGPASIGAL